MFDHIPTPDPEVATGHSSSRVLLHSFERNGVELFGARIEATSIAASPSEALRGLAYAQAQGYIEATTRVQTVETRDASPPGVEVA